MDGLAPLPHTPAPWFRTKQSTFNDVARIGRSWIIASELPLAEFGHPDADAALLAAAPELLAALLEVLAAVRATNRLPQTTMQAEAGLDRIRAAVLRAEAAIAKAQLT